MWTVNDTLPLLILVKENTPHDTCSLLNHRSSFLYVSHLRNDAGRQVTDARPQHQGFYLNLSGVTNMLSVWLCLCRICPSEFGQWAFAKQCFVLSMLGMLLCLQGGETLLHSEAVNSVGELQAQHLISNPEEIRKFVATSYTLNHDRRTPAWTFAPTGWAAQTEKCTSSWTFCSSHRWEHGCDSYSQDSPGLAFAPYWQISLSILVSMKISNHFWSISGSFKRLSHRVGLC